ncbi:MAG: hypothetical protein ACE365_00395 [Gammaproteobacteria bacterium]
MLPRENTQYTVTLDASAYNDRRYNRVDCGHVVNLRKGDDPQLLLEHYIRFLKNPNSLSNIDIHIQEPTDGPPKGKEGKTPKIDSLYLTPLTVMGFNHLDNINRKRYYILLELMSRLYYFKESHYPSFTFHFDENFNCDINNYYINKKICHASSFNGPEEHFILLSGNRQSNIDDIKEEEREDVHDLSDFFGLDVRQAELMKTFEYSVPLLNNNEVKGEEEVLANVPLMQTNVNPNRDNRELIDDLIVPFIIAKLIEENNYPLIAVYLKKANPEETSDNNLPTTFLFKPWVLEDFTSLDDYDDIAQFMLATMLEVRLPENIIISSDGEQPSYLFDDFFRILIDRTATPPTNVYVTNNFFCPEHPDKENDHPYSILNNPFIVKYKSPREYERMNDAKSGGLMSLLYPYRRKNNFEQDVGDRAETTCDFMDCLPFG